MGEHTFALMIAYSRGIALYRDNQREKAFKRFPVPFDLFESTVGIVGLGGIGSELAKRAKAFGMRVLAIKRDTRVAFDYVDELHSPDKIDYLLEQSDVIVLSMALTPETRHCISTKQLEKIKKNACLINVARGPVVDTEALIQALRNKSIGGACLDTTDPEPLPEDSPLWDMPNVIITPHVANESPSTNRFRFKFYRDNLHKFLAGKPLENQVMAI